MLRILYTPSFVRQYDALPRLLQEEVQERITLFCTDPKHPTLRTHKLKGALKGRWSFHVNYRYRIVFCYEEKGTAALLVVGDHRIYR